MKNLLLALLVFTSMMTVSAQDSIPAGFAGIHEIVIGAKFESIKKLLEPKPVWGRFVNWQIEMEGDENPTEEMYGPKDVWLVKSTETKYFTYMDVKVKRIEVLLDENQRVKDITLMIENVSTNWSVIKAGSLKKYGSTVFSASENGKEDYYPWEKGGYKYSIANWDAYSPEASEELAEKWVYVNFTRAGE